MAKMVFETCNDHQINFNIAHVSAEMPQGLNGLNLLDNTATLKYRSAAREFLFKADIAES